MKIWLPPLGRDEFPPAGASDVSPASSSCERSVRRKMREQLYHDHVTQAAKKCKQIHGRKLLA